MKVEINGTNNNFISHINKAQKIGSDNRPKMTLNDAVSKELASFDDEILKDLTNAKNTIVVDVLDIKPHGLVVDARLFDNLNMPVSGKTCLMEITKVKEFADPKVLAQHLSVLAKKLVENAKMLR